MGMGEGYKNKFLLHSKHTSLTVLNVHLEIYIHRICIPVHIWKMGVNHIGMCTLCKISPTAIMWLAIVKIHTCTGRKSTLLTIMPHMSSALYALVWFVYTGTMFDYNCVTEYSK